MARLGLRDHKGHRGRRGSKDSKDPLVMRERQDRQGRRGRRDHRDPKGTRERRERRGWKASKDQVDQPARPVIKAHKESPANKRPLRRDTCTGGYRHASPLRNSFPNHLHCSQVHNSPRAHKHLMLL